MRLPIKRNRTLWAGSLAAAVLTVAAACTGDDPAPTPAPTLTSAPTATAQPQPSPAPATAEPTLPAAAARPGSGIEGGDPAFDASALVWQGYWLSRDHFGPFVMASGMGIPFAPPMEMLQAAIQMVAQNPDDPVMLPQNMMPLQAIYASGGSDLLNDPRDFDPLDFEGLRLDPASFDETVRVRGQAFTMLKESQWAHSFADSHFGAPDGDFGAQQRFMGVMVNMLAQMQGKYAMENLMGADGLYHDSDGALDYTANWVMLHTLSDIAGLAADGRYANPDMQPMFDNAATMLFQALSGRGPESAEEAAAAIRALAYRASTTADDEVRAGALALARSIVDEVLVGFASDDVVDNAAAIAGLISAASVLDSDDAAAAAAGLFASLSEEFDAQHGVFTSKSTYSADDVAWIVGALNALIQQGPADLEGPAMDMLLAFYESTMSLGGMQLSAPPGKNGAMAGEWEKSLPGVIYYHPVDTPPPPAVGKLTVPAAEIQWNGSGWDVTSDRFDSGGAMHLANELNWLGPHLGSVMFPEVPG